MLKKEILYQSLIKNLIKYYNEENNKRKYAMLKYWLPLKQHLIDTKNVALLLRNTTFNLVLIQGYLY